MAKQQPHDKRRPPGASRGSPPRARAAGHRTPSPADTDEHTLIYGIHAVEAALDNPRRRIHELLLTQNAENRLARAIAARGLAPVRAQPRDLDRRLGPDTVHQGALLICDELEQIPLAALMAKAIADQRPLVMLDQVTDPHNVGAVLRSCAVFGSAGVIMPRRHSPPLAGTTAKSASGALELMPVCLVQNLVRTLAELTAAGFRIFGLDGTAPDAIENLLDTSPTVIVLGSEGRGLRQATAAACTHLAHVSTDGTIASLNVSNAAAIALYAHALTRKGMLQGSARIG